VLRSLRNSQGGPTLAVRVVAALVALGLLALSAPVVLPVFRWLFQLVV
jgi:hypothetical protein